MPLITLGENDELKLKIPSRGDIDWAEDFKLYFANPIVKHDHSGINGMGKQLGASSLSNNAIEERHVNFGLGALNEVSIPSDSSTIASNSYLRWSGNAWAPGSLDPSELSIYNPDPIGEGGTAGISTTELSEIYITEKTNSDFPNGSWAGSSSIDLTSKGALCGVKIIADVPNPDGKKIIVQSLKSCVIISNIDIEVSQTIDKCVMILENDDSTSANTSCNLIVTNTTTDTIIDSSDIIADSIISGSHTNTKTLFRDSKIKIKDLDLQMTAAATSIVKIERSVVDISGQISNGVDLSSDTNNKLDLDSSKVSFSTLNQIGTGIFDVDANSELKQIASNYVKVWAGTRWNYLVSPSTKGALISSDSSGVPSELSVGSNGTVLSANSSTATGLEWVSQSSLVSSSNIETLSNVDTSGVVSGQFLKYDGNNWVDTSILQVPSGGIDGQVLTKTSSGYAWQAATEKSHVKIKQTLTFDSGDTTQNITIGSNEYAEVVIIKNTVSGGHHETLSMNNGGEGPIHAKFGPGTLTLTRVNTNQASITHAGTTYPVSGSTAYNVHVHVVHVIVFQNS